MKTTQDIRFFLDQLWHHVVYTPCRPMGSIICNSFSISCAYDISNRSIDTSDERHKHRLQGNKVLVRNH
jgi:hypothetical protein